MNWQCRLYGHQWRHPGTYEVVLVDGPNPSYPFQCDVCGYETLVEARSSRSRETVDYGPPDTKSDLESGSELDGAEEPRGE